MIMMKSVTTTTNLVLLLLLLPTTTTIVVVTGFSGVLFQDAVAQRRSTPSKTAGVDIELPDFNELFDRIQHVSPLARQVQQLQQQQRRSLSLTSSSNQQQRGFAHIAMNGEDGDPNYPPLPWKTIEKNPRKTVHSIEKIDNFNGQGAPLLRFRSTLTGPCIGECFANFIMDLDQRRQWDTQIADVTELYPVHDLDSANIAMGFGRYGDCSRLGVGYCLTKAGLGISPREQLTLCGIQDFCHDGADNNDDDDDESSGASCVIWGTEMADKRHNDLFPPGTGRHTRAKSHIFATTLTPTSDTTFDVEYVLQLEIGGSLPTWLTTPIVIDSIKSLFRTAEAFFADDRKGSGLDRYLQDKAAQQASQFNFANHQGLLMTP